MPIDFQKVINSSFALNVLAVIARGIPRRIGYPLCDLVGDWIAKRRDSKLSHAVRLNQWVARGENFEKGALDQVVQETLRNNARDIYNLYHYLGRPQAMQKMICISPEAREVIERPGFTDRGLVILGLHLSNFDFVLRSLIQNGFKPLVLTIPDPQGGRRVEYEMRKRTGVNLLPTSVGAIRTAVKHLRQGGMVVTGLDHPAPEVKLRPEFFRRPASLPTHYIYLASKARVPIVVMPVIQQSDGKYYVFLSAQMEIQHHLDQEKEILHNAERVLKEAEKFIRMAPQQWNVPLPIWPELLGKI